MFRRNPRTWNPAYPKCLVGVGWWWALGDESAAETWAKPPLHPPKSQTHGHPGALAPPCQWCVVHCGAWECCAQGPREGRGCGQRVMAPNLNYSESQGGVCRLGCPGPHLPASPRCCDSESLSCGSVCAWCVRRTPHLSPSQCQCQWWRDCQGNVTRRVLVLRVCGPFRTSPRGVGGWGRQP